MAVRIRQYASSDQEFILSMISRFSDFELPAWRQRAEIDDTNRTSMEQALEKSGSDSAIFVAEEDNGQFAGFIHLETETDYFTGEKIGYISDLAVGTAFEGQGMGRRLLETAETWARAKGYRLLALYVFAGNVRAQRLYEKKGYQPEVIKYVKHI
jgi:ribosomal protein S18 acetylase RimI-like enzyme